MMATVSLVAVAAVAHLTVPDNGNGTADLPPLGLEYVIPAGFPPIQIINGLPAGTTIDIDAVLRGFFNETEVPGGLLGGELQQYNAVLEMPMTGTGALAGFNRNISFLVTAESHSGPRTPFDPVQSFPTDMFQLQGGLIADPDFDIIEIRIGTNLGLPSPGHTTLTQYGPDWEVDSYFDVEYVINFVGAPGSILEGFSGATQGTTRIATNVNSPGAACSPADMTTQGAGIGDPLYGVPDGLITGADIQYYVNLWLAGCP